MLPTGLLVRILVELKANHQEISEAIKNNDGVTDLTDLIIVENQLWLAVSRIRLILDEEKSRKEMPT